MIRIENHSQRKIELQFFLKMSQLLAVLANFTPFNNSRRRYLMSIKYTFKSFMVYKTTVFNID